MEVIQHQTTIAYTPEQNCVAERSNRTLVERARSIMIDAHVIDTSHAHTNFWAVAIATVNHCKNVSPTYHTRSLDC